MKTAILILAALLLASCITGTVSYTDPETGATATINVTPKPEK